MSALTTTQLYRLDNAVAPIRRSVDCGIYLVGSTQTGKKRPRDVDVRAIVDDATFDSLFPNEKWWALVSYAVARMLSDDTGLPIDFQFQRQTEANEHHSGPRNPLGLGRGRVFAGGGDATPSTKTEGWR